MGNGARVEEYARRLAAGLGVPDFVYRPAHAPRGSGTREIGDGLVVAGGSGLILQVKSRDPEAAARASPDRAVAWVRKHAQRALEQAYGSRRTLYADSSTRFVSMRGYERTLPPGGNGPWSC